MAKPVRKAPLACSPKCQPTAAAGSMPRENSISRMPRMRWIWEYCMGATCPWWSEESKADLKQPLDVTDMLLVDNEQDHMIIRFDNRAVMGNQHFFIAYHSAYGGARWQLDLADGPPDHS